MKCSLGISNFLEEISSLCILCLFALIIEEGFLISPCYSLQLCIQMGISFLSSFAFSFSCCLMQVKKQQLELDKEQKTGYKLKKVYIKSVYCYPAYLTYMRGTSCKMLGWMKHKLESRLLGEISITSDMQMIYHSNGRKQRRTKEPLDESERGKWKSWLKTQHSENLRSWHPVPSLHGKQIGKQWKQWETLFSWAPKSLKMVTAAKKLKDTFFLDEKLWPN